MASPMMVEERQARITEIRARQEELNTEFAGQTFSDDARTEFEALAAERAEHDRAIEELEQRRTYLEEQASEPANRESGTSFQTRRSGVARGEDIYDLSTIRSSVSSPQEARHELHERSKRAIETAVFPDDRVRKDHAQAHIERLLQRDSRDGELGQIILRTGRPGYREAFVKFLGGAPLTGEESRAFNLSSTGLPVPYTLDPTVLPVSNSVVNPLRAISSVEQIVGSNEWRGLTAGAITATRVSEVTEATDNTPTLAQPTIPTSKAHAFVPFSIESGQDWTGMDSALAVSSRTPRTTRRPRPSRRAAAPRRTRPVSSRAPPRRSRRARA
jgi:HK97 family phage major capsid protein